MLNLQKTPHSLLSQLHYTDQVITEPICIFCLSTISSYVCHANSFALNCFECTISQAIWMLHKCVHVYAWVHMWKAIYTWEKAYLTKAVLGQTIYNSRWGSDMGYKCPLNQQVISDGKCLAFLYFYYLRYAPLAHIYVYIYVIRHVTYGTYPHVHRMMSTQIRPELYIYYTYTLKYPRGCDDAYIR